MIKSIPDYEGRPDEAVKELMETTRQVAYCLIEDSTRLYLDIKQHRRVLDDHRSFD